MLTAATITDEQCKAVVELMPFDVERNLLAGALGTVEPHRNHSRYELAKRWNALACTNCTLRYIDSQNHPQGMVFVGWGHGWQPCIQCKGSGLSPMGQMAKNRVGLNARAAKAQADGINEPFCACGHRISQCDGSRTGCNLNARAANIIESDGHIRDCGNGGSDPADCSPECVKVNARAAKDLSIGERVVGTLDTGGELRGEIIALVGRLATVRTAEGRTFTRSLNELARAAKSEGK